MHRSSLVARTILVLGVALALSACSAQQVTGHAAPAESTQVPAASADTPARSSIPSIGGRPANCPIDVNSASTIIGVQASIGPYQGTDQNICDFFLPDVYHRFGAAIFYDGSASDSKSGYPRTCIFQPEPSLGPSGLSIHCPGDEARATANMVFDAGPNSRIEVGGNLPQSTTTAGSPEEKCRRLAKMIYDASTR